MALSSVTQGAVANAIDVNQFVNLLTGSMTDQQITVANRVRAQITGATTATGYVGGVAGGPPTSGTFALGDFVFDQTYGNFWCCISAGTPGTWQAVSAGVISKQTLGSPAATVTFSSIPGGFTNLWLVGSAAATGVANNVDCSCTFNADSAADYGMITWDASQAAQTPAGASSMVTTNFPWFLAVPGTSYGGTGRAGSFSVLIPNYASTAMQKITLHDMSMGDGGTSYNVHKRWGNWKSTSALTSIAITCGNGNFTANSVFELYGLP